MAVRLNAEQVAAIGAAMTEHGVESIEVDQGRDGRLLVRSVEVIERTRPLRIGNGSRPEHEARPEGALA